MCIHAQFKCDGDDDCGDNSDEQGCGEYVWRYCLSVCLSVYLRRTVDVIRLSCDILFSLFYFQSPPVPPRSSSVTTAIA